MAFIKTKKERDLILEGGLLLGAILDDLATMVRPGVTSLEIDREAERRIREVGGIPAFKGYAPSGHPPFPGTICASVNDEIVHGIPSKHVLIEGQIFSIDIGIQYPVNSGLGKDGNGYFTDTAITVPVGEINSQARQLISVTQKALEKAIDSLQIGTGTVDIGRVIERYVEPQGYGIVRDLVGAWCRARSTRRPTSSKLLRATIQKCKTRSRKRYRNRADDYCWGLSDRSARR
jgi:methionyl aminopeptidase